MSATKTPKAVWGAPNHSNYDECEPAMAKAARPERIKFDLRDMLYELAEGSKKLADSIGQHGTRSMTDEEVAISDVAINGKIGAIARELKIFAVTCQNDSFDDAVESIRELMDMKDELGA